MLLDLYWTQFVASRIKKQHRDLGSNWAICGLLLQLARYSTFNDTKYNIITVGCIGAYARFLAHGIAYEQIKN